MIKAYPLDFIRHVIEQTLYEENLLEPHKYFGGKNQVNLFSFYEQLQKEDEVDRYVEIYRDLTEQQNRTGLIMNGTIIAPENPTITNLYKCTIIPMAFTCSFRVKLGDRDRALETLNNLIYVLKGRKRDIAEFNNGELLMVGTMGENMDGTPTLREGDYVGEYRTGYLDDDIRDYLTDLNTDYGLVLDLTKDKYFYATYKNTIANTKTLVVIKYDYASAKFVNVDYEDDPINLIIPPQHDSFTKYKISLSFDSIRCDEPRNLNANEYCVISFGGSATLVSNGVMLGNDMIKLSFEKSKIETNPIITINGGAVWLEPLEMPNSSNADTLLNQLHSNNFINNTHTDSLTLSKQYTFILDTETQLLKEWFEYARYGKQANLANIATNKSGITPNLIYKINEYWCSWGEFERYTTYGKIVESIDIENTESDTLTITIPIQLQGENN